MGFEDEVEQSFGRPYRQCNGRSKRTHELTSSIVPRGTSFHHRVELKFSPIAFDPGRSLRCCDFPGPTELGAVNPDAVHDHGEATCQRHDRLLLVGLTASVTAGPSGLTNSPHPSSREGHHSTTGWSSSFLLSRLILDGPYAAAGSRVQRNSVPSTQMRCMITARRRASATIAFFIPRCLAIFIAQALSQDHLLVRVSMTWAAS
jgi:hypothetical protein